MIGKPEWFQRRKYGGWGISPRTWQGWVYLAAVFVPFVVFQIIPVWSDMTRIVITLAWVLFLAIDVTDVMVRMKRDERERLHEAIAERNALWVMMLVLVFGVGYQVAVSVVKKSVEVDPFMVVALFLGLIVKTVSNVYLDRKN